MMKSRLLESIGGVDEELLEQAETAQYSRRRPVFKVLLVAAIIAVCTWALGRFCAAHTQLVDMVYLSRKIGEENA